MGQSADEGQRVANRRQEGIAARLVGLWLHREAHPVLAIDHVLAQEVHGLAEAVQGVSRSLRRHRLHAFAAAPEDVDLGPKLGPDVDRPHRLGDGVAAHRSVV